jgi:REP element-mobilizing transposase RayT
MGHTKSGHGGRRVGAGRKPSQPRKRVGHAARGEHSSNFPVHVTLRSRLHGLRQQTLLSVFARAIRAANFRSARLGKNSAAAPFRVVHYSLQGNHVHLLVEAQDKLSLSRGMQGLAASLALRMNRALRRRGAFWADRFHSRELMTTTGVRRALVYVLANHRKHVKRVRPGVDPFSSGFWFRDWKESSPRPLSVSISPGVLDPKMPAVAPAQTWLLGSGWKRHGAISFTETPRLTQERTHVSSAVAFTH